MRDPARWKLGENAPPGARDLLRSAPGPRPMAVPERARTAARIAQIPAAASAGGGAAAGWSAGIKAMAIVVGVGAGGLAAQALRGDGPAAIVTPARHLPMEPFRARALEAQAAPTPAAPDTPGAVVANSPDMMIKTNPRRAPPRRGAPQVAASATPDADALLREAELLEQARTGVAADPADSLRALDDHRASFPAGQLTAEREYLAIAALARLGRKAEARARARAFVARFPASPFAERARRIADTNP